ncbi:unnamed protein product [Mytilus coruscus]|uniref:TRIM71 n=1 Tax=Mytilus coruscus TaxID=42192 RepID=A0A6J8CVF1_MYTCO|nr:unnamed protein product [Mytilus coruscus]
MMNKKGDKEFVYKHDQHSPTLITVPKRITSTNNGNIHVVDQISEDFSGKVVVLGHDGHLIYKYSGLSATNNTSPFKPRHIVTTPSDNVVVIDRDIPILHILNNNGHFVSYFNTEEIGIQFPYSLAFNTTGHLYIGCTKGAGHKSTEAKLYETNIAGF